MPGEGRESKKEVRPPWFFLIAAFIMISDQASKFLIKKCILPNDSIPVIKDLFHLTLVFNKGAAFGIFKAQGALLTVIAILAVVMIALQLLRMKKGFTLAGLGLCAILGGVIGNLFDRMRYGYVVDFLDFRIWPVFNVADTAITIGAVLLIIHVFKLKTQKSKLKTTIQNSKRFEF